MGDTVEVCAGDGRDPLDDHVSIIRLLRIFLGAAVKDGERRHSLQPEPTPTQNKDQRLPRTAAAAAAREQAGCTLWDMSADEGHASAMCAAGLTAILCKVLGDCADAKARVATDTTTAAVTALARANPPGGPEEAKVAAALGAKADAPDTAKAAGEPLVMPGGQGVERLREVACGLLANVCSHQSLRQQIAGDPSLGQGLLRAFHDSDDPAPLTELLRLFSTVALTKIAANSNGVASMALAGAGVGAEAVPEAAVARAVGLAWGLAERETLERLAFFLENSLEERLLAWACSLAFSLMYRHGDVVIRPLVDVYQVEESLAALLNSRSTDLSYEKLGGTETGLDALLRCLEVLSTSEASSLGPSPPPVTVPPGATGPRGDATAGAAAVGGGGRASEVRDLEEPQHSPPPPPPPQQQQQQQQHNKRKKRDEEEQEEEEGGGQELDEGRSKARRNSVAASTTAAMTKTTTRTALNRTKRRGGVIRGLVATLVPWEHSRRIQRAALLVLGNVLGNALEEGFENDPQGFQDREGGGGGGGGGGGEARCSPAACCAEELDKSLATWGAEGGGEWSEGVKDGSEEDAAGVERLASARRKFQETVNKLVGGDEGEGLGEELQEAVETVQNVLDKDLVRCTA